MSAAIRARQPGWKTGEENAICDKNCREFLDRNCLCLYLFAITGLCLMYSSFQDLGLSTLLTLSVLIQVTALGALLIAVITRRSVRGISLRSMSMQALSFFLRLCSTCWLKGYIPVDSTGDWLYQVSDLVAWALCMQICYLICTTYSSSYQAREDTFAASYVSFGCFCLAVVIHPDLNNRPFFDAIWTASLYVDVVSTLPQLWMIGKLGGKVDALSAHYVALIALSRAVDMFFWTYGFEELAPENGSFNLAGWTVLGAHAIHLLLMWDFIYCYCRAIYQGKLLNNEFDFGDILLDV